jgi:hypothetical protein
LASHITLSPDFTCRLEASFGGLPTQYEILFGVVTMSIVTKWSGAGAGADWAKLEPFVEATELATATLLAAARNCLRLTFVPDFFNMKASVTVSQPLT